MIIGNCRINLDAGALKDFFDKTKSMGPEDRGHALENDEGISKAHEESAQEGQTEVIALFKVQSFDVMRLMSKMKIYILVGTE